MSVLVTLYSNVSHTYSVSSFSIQGFVLSRFPIFCIKFHFQEHGRLLGKGTKKFLSGSTLPPSKEKAEHGDSIWLRIHFKLVRLN